MNEGDGAESDQKRRHPDFELKEALLNGKYEEEGWRIRKNGEPFWANVTITELRDHAGAIVGFASAVVA